MSAGAAAPHYEVVAGRIQTWALEAHIADHCNLTCVQCCSLSPGAPERFMDPAALERDLARLAPILRPQLFKLTGGEPLLHPDVLGCLRVARASGIAPQISITTNGFLIRSAPEALWGMIDRMTLSWYTSAPLPEALRDYLGARAREAGVLLTVKPADRFQRITPADLRDTGGAAAAFASCWLRHRCHTVHEGRFYLCTRPPHLGPFLVRHGVVAEFAEGDGVNLDTPGLRAALLRYLRREDPIASCGHCLGATGDWAPHAQGWELGGVAAAGGAQSLRVRGVPGPPR